MANPLVKSGLNQLVQELVDLFHASKNVNMLQGVRGNPALSAGFNQGRGIYGFRSRDRAIRHLENLISGKQKQLGANFNAERMSPGVSRIQVPKESVRFDVTGLDADPEYHGAFYDLVKKNQSPLNDLLRTRNIRTMNPDPSLRGRILGINERGGSQGRIVPPPEQIEIEYEKVRPNRTIRSSEPLLKDFEDQMDSYDGEESEAFYGRIADALRQVDREGYNELRDLMLLNPNLAFRTTASPKMTEVYRSPAALDLLLDSYR